MDFFSDSLTTDPLGDAIRFPAGPPLVRGPGRLPAGGAVSLGAVTLGPGRPVVPRDVNGGSPPPALWATDDVVPDAALAWCALAEQFPATGLWPLLLHGLYDGSGRPWDHGELEPVSEAAIDALDPYEVLEAGWHGSIVPINNPWAPGTGPLSPFGPGFPGLAPAQPPSDATPLELVDAAGARLGLVSCRRPADVPALVGWLGTINVTGAAEISAVLRSWEDRFGAILVGLGFATITLLVTRPPTTDDDALRVAAEVAALCPDSLWQPEALWPYEFREPSLEELTRRLVRKHVWRLWFD